MSAAVEGMARARQLLGDFRFSEFRIVRELRFYEEADVEDRIERVELVVESEDRSPNYRLHLSFAGVSGLRIVDFGGGETRVIGLDIVDVSDRQWQDVKWEIVDFEHDVLFFRAASAEIKDVVEA